MTCRFAFVFIAALLAACGPGDTPRSWLGRVAWVIDGDTLDVLRVAAHHRATAVRVRLQQVDCPERDQPFGAAARAFSESLVLGRTVRVVPHTLDVYGRIIGDLQPLDASRPLQEALLAAGLAWHDGRFERDSRLAALEATARHQRQGLWIDLDPVPPWRWREQHR